MARAGPRQSLPGIQQRLHQRARRGQQPAPSAPRRRQRKPRRARGSPPSAGTSCKRTGPGGPAALARPPRPARAGPRTARTGRLRGSAAQAGAATQHAGRPPGPLPGPALGLRRAHPLLSPQRPPPPAAAHLPGRRRRRRYGRRARSRETSLPSVPPPPHTPALPAARADPGLERAWRAPPKPPPGLGVGPSRARDPASTSRPPFRPPL
ncbi:atherin-like [Equus przewalskii]|uniref:Atherin-like n=1 Tax=Equus przewalskii TaxID=9798 RepID=A0ABM4KA18_EQUPR